MIYFSVTYTKFKPFLLDEISVKRYSANIDLLKANNRNTRKKCEICLKLTIRVPEDVNDIW